MKMGNKKKENFQHSLFFLFFFLKKKLSTMLSDFYDKKLTYTSQYCEENVYHLCKIIWELDGVVKNKYDIYVSFISNEKRMVSIEKKNSLFFCNLFNC